MGQQRPGITPHTAKRPGDPGARLKPGWLTLQKQRFKSLIEWLAKGAEHACPT